MSRGTGNSGSGSSIGLSSGLAPELLQEIKTLHFHTRRLADQGMRGSYRSAFRGQGIEVEELREYLPGDDVRSIDWKVTARSQKPYIKSYREERELTVLIAVDLSASTLTGTRNQLREKLLARVGAVLTFIALTNNDKVGLVTFSDRIEQYHPPRKARTAVWRILQEVLAPRAQGRKTDLPQALAFINRVLKRHSIIFLLSDFFDKDFELPLATLAKRHDVTAMVVRDPIDFRLPGSGLYVPSESVAAPGIVPAKVKHRPVLVEIEDPETGARGVIDLSSAESHRRYEQAAARKHRELDQVFSSLGIDAVELRTDQEFMPVLRRYFHSRSKGTASATRHTARLVSAR